MLDKASSAVAGPYQSRFHVMDMLPEPEEDM